MMPPAAVHLISSDGGPITVTSYRISDSFYLVAIVLLGALLYCNAIHGQFIWDDRAAVVRRDDAMTTVQYQASLPAPSFYTVAISTKATLLVLISTVYMLGDDGYSIDALC
jgi:hypothetical protein